MGTGQKIAVLYLGLFLSGSAYAENKNIVRIGHFPNLTHAPALLGRAKGSFEEALKDHAKIDWKIFNAGPSVVEAMFAKQLDIAYIGPSPAVNAYVKSGGEAIRVVAGVTSGGAALVVREKAGIREIQDFQGKKIASPQYGNTQDVSLRSWLKNQGLKLKEYGGNVQIIPLTNPDQLSLFIKGQMDAAWTVEPWVSRLVQEGGGRVFLKESELWPGGQYSTALIIVRREFLDKNPGLVKKFLHVHVQTIDWIQKNPEEARKTLNEEIKRETGKPLPQTVMDAAFSNIEFTVDPLMDSVQKQAEAAHKAGFLKEAPELEELFSLKLLEEVLGDKMTASSQKDVS